MVFSDRILKNTVVIILSILLKIVCIMSKHGLKSEWRHYLIIYQDPAVRSIQFWKKIIKPEALLNSGIWVKIPNKDRVSRSRRMPGSSGQIKGFKFSDTMYRIINARRLSQNVQFSKCFNKSSATRAEPKVNYIKIRNLKFEMLLQNL